MLAVLVREDAGDSIVGEKYESPALCPGDCPPPCVCTLSTPEGGGIGNLGGGARTTPASDAVLSFVPERPRRLVLDALRFMTPPEELVVEPKLTFDAIACGCCTSSSSSSSSSCWAYGFSILLTLRIHVKSGAACSGLAVAVGVFSFRCVSRPVAHFLIISSFVNLITKFSTPGSPFHHI